MFTRGAPSHRLLDEGGGGGERHNTRGAASYGIPDEGASQKIRLKILGANIIVNTKNI